MERVFCHDEFLCDGVDKRNGIGLIVDYMQNLVGESNELIVDTRALIKEAK